MGSAIATAIAVRRSSIRTTAAAFWRSRTGVTAIEYAIIGSVISISVVVGARAIGVNLTPFFTSVAGNM